MITRALSADAKDIIKESREIACELGYDYISTIHFFLADCKLNRPDSIRKFAFPNDAAFNTIWNGCRLAEPIIVSQELMPLTKEAERVLRQASVISYLFSEKEILPCHIFLAAFKVKGAVLADCFTSPGNKYDRLSTYYSGIGQINLLKLNSLYKKILLKFPFLLSIGIK